MTIRDVEGLLIVAVSALTVLLTVSDLRRGHHTKNFNWLQAIRVLFVAYIGLLYFLAVINLSSILGGGAITMSYYRSGVLLLLMTILIDAVWRYRGGS